MYLQWLRYPALGLRKKGWNQFRSSYVLGFQRKSNNFPRQSLRKKANFSARSSSTRAHQYLNFTKVFFGTNKKHEVMIENIFFFFIHVRYFIIYLPSLLSYWWSLIPTYTTHETSRFAASFSIYSHQTIPDTWWLFLSRKSLSLERTRLSKVAEIVKEYIQFSFKF